MATTIGFPGQATHERPKWGRRRQAPVFARNGMMASAHPLITSAGLRALASGGNAVDAAVSAALTATVVMPEMCGLGGDLFAIVHAPAANGSGHGETLAFLGSGISPRNATLAQMREVGDNDGKTMPFRGPHAVAVPGMVDAYFALLQRFGSRSFAELAGPAIGYAADGFPVTRAGAAALGENAELLARFPASAAVFLPDGQPPRPGGLLRQPGLGRTLRQIAEGGVDVFYRGDVAARICRAMADAGGNLCLDDMADHATEVTSPLSTTYRDYRIYETGLPTQGLILLESLNIVEQTDLANLGVDAATGIHQMVEAKKLAYADRLAYLADPAFCDPPLAALLSKSWAAGRAAEIDPHQANDMVKVGQLSEGDTTYLCVVDGQGMMVSLIQSVSAAFGCGMVAGDTGVVLNNRAGRGFSLEDGHVNIFAPGKKTMHTLNCYLIAAGDGTPVLVGGTPGGDGQPQWNLQVIAGLIDAGLDVQTAIEQPRWMSWPGTDPSTITNRFELRIEDRAGDAVLDELERLGHQVRRLGAWGSGGAAQAVARDPDSGILAGGSDPRVEGLALGL